MYSHILVPTDGTALSVHTVTKAVEFARTVGARITFFYADPDASASLTDDAALLQLIAPDTYRDDYSGRAREILSKAAVSAGAAGIECETVSRTSTRPHAAILAAADELGCDLIFMSSHGPRSFGGVMLGSETLKVLVGAKVPVLVSSVEKNDPAPAMNMVTSIMKDEHRSIAVVAYGLRTFARGLQENRPVDFDLLKSMLGYLRAFPSKLHHPKEEAYLFKKVQERTAELDPLIAELQRQHREGDAALHALVEAIETLGTATPDERIAFVTRLESFAGEQLKHIGMEESRIMPAAARCLLPEDWTSIARAFGENGDLRFAEETRESFRRLFSRIANLQ